MEFIRFTHWRNGTSIFVRKHLISHVSISDINDEFTYIEYGQSQHVYVKETVEEVMQLLGATY